MVCRIPMGNFVAPTWNLPFFLANNFAPFVYQQVHVTDPTRITFRLNLASLQPSPSKSLTLAWIIHSVCLSNQRTMEKGLQTHSPFLRSTSKEIPPQKHVCSASKAVQSSPIHRGQQHRNR
mmetsp:Transcript_51243/g.59861  ORF Transcript_51243/g.59861 Transcript_51243/m.59861 type:complete len:121 (-) Transcript_51243:3-365(-)